jgi:RNA polymerase sigma-70 factor (ECF subfamily)
MVANDAPAAGGSFEDVAERLSPKLYRIAMSLCRNPDEAQDLVQDTMLQAQRKWDQFEGRSDPATWLYTIAARQCRRRHRRKVGEPQRLESLDDLLPASVGPIADLAGLEDPERSYDRREVRRAVSSAIGELPAPFRVPLVLVDIAELSVAEVANILGVKEATVKTRVHRARLKLRKVLAGRLPMRQVPPGDHDRRVCLDLLRAKQDALDRRVPFSMTDHALCERCASVFGTMDLARQVCRAMGREPAVPQPGEPAPGIRAGAARSAKG